MESQQNLKTSKFIEYKFEWPRENQYCNFRSFFIDPDPTLKELMKMPGREYLLGYLQRLSRVKELDPELRDYIDCSHILIYNFIKELTITVDADSDKIVMNYRNVTAIPVSAFDDSNNELPPPMEDEKDFWRYFTSMTDFFFTQEPLRLAVDFYGAVCRGKIRLPGEIETDSAITPENESKAINKVDVENSVVVEKRDEAETTITVKGSFMRSAVFGEQQSVYRYPDKQKRKLDSKQLDIFDQLGPNTQASILAKNLDKEWANERGLGIKLTPAEEKLVFCLSMLLHHKSQTLDKAAVDYFAGNVSDPNSLPFPWAGKHDLRINIHKRPADHPVTTDPLIRKTPTLDLTLYELTRAYNGGAKVAGPEMKTVLKLLNQLADDPKKRIIVKYKREQPLKDGRRIVDRVEGFEPLLNVYSGTREITSVDDIVISSTTQIIIRLNALFVDQIDQKFHRYPNSLLGMLYEANGGKKDISSVTFGLLRHFDTFRSSQKYVFETGVDKLYWKLAEDWMQDSKRSKKHVKKYVDKGLQHMKAIGLLLDWKIIPDKSGEPKYRFRINPNWV
ncbi:hypothetical protein [Larkinella knui]|uniref:Uncharacterized protein n=1 Tax=Larkinella knui TaxID=2025310 RepID=A0A3P1CPQ2_9BACT|nr:hypothetical protein [Larkinella knui]RRB15218.1 hypothetical protein EHT87_11790 [Larkinella knui]